MLFAAILGTTAANAQEAEARVYKTPADTTFTGASFSPQDTLAEIAASLPSSFRPSYIRFINSSGARIQVDSALGPNGLPVVPPSGVGGQVSDRDNTELRAGDLIQLTDAVLGGGVDITLRVYGDAPANLRLAEGDESLTLKTSADLDTAAGEFFLTNDWRMTTVATSDTRDYARPDCVGDTPDLSADGSICQTEGAAAAETAPDSAPAPGDDGNARDLAVVGLGLGVVGFMAAYLSGGDFSLFHFAPDYGYSFTESGYSVNTGGRLDFRKDRWHLYYAAGQENANGEFGDFRYESGGKYSADLWTAAFSETVQGETADYNFALSADYHGGIWRLSPTYRLHSHLTETDSETDNALNLEGVLRYNRWTISPSAGFRWESADEFGDNARFHLSAVRRF